MSRDRQPAAGNLERFIVRVNQLPSNLREVVYDDAHKEIVYLDFRIGDRRPCFVCLDAIQAARRKAQAEADGVAFRPRRGVRARKNP